MKTTKIELPMAPTINHYWKHKVVGKFASVYVSIDGLDFQRAVKWIVMELGLKTLTGRLIVDIVLFFPTLGRNDIDNRLKACLDALTKAGVWLDDSQIDQLTVRRGEKTKGGMMQVEITEI
jgi:crossover junction endodeoxyribonuclease RusA